MNKAIPIFFLVTGMIFVGLGIGYNLGINQSLCVAVSPPGPNTGVNIYEVPR